MRIRTLLSVALLALLAACEQPLPTPVEPTLEAPAAGAAFSEATARSDDGTYLVLARGNRLGAALAEVRELGGQVTFRHGGVGLAIVTGLDADAAAALRATDGITDVVADDVFTLEDPRLAGTMAAQPASPADPTTASWFPAQWNMRAIGADDAWAAGRLGSSDVTVAILDTGIDYTYPDLVGRVDLGRSVSFVPGDDALVATFFPGAHPIADIHYHGTHVASTVASNGLVAAGVTSGTTLMGVKVCSVFGRCGFGAVVSGILHAVDEGADVINMSLGGAFLRAGAGGFGSVINTLFNYANQNGVTVVVAAGNAAADLDRNFHPNQDGEQTHFPSLYATYCDTPATVCVAATGPTAGGTFTTGPWTDVDASAVYTNYGRSAINVAAPGGNVGAAVVAACSGFSLVIPICRTGVFVVGLAGTSMATPHVSGVAALLVEDHGRRPSRITNVLQQSADDLGQPGTDPFYGKGRINVATAVGH